MCPALGVKRPRTVAERARPLLERLAVVDQAHGRPGYGLRGAGGFPEGVAKYLAKKYGYRPEAGAAADARVAQLLQMLAARLKAQRAAGSPYYLGNTITAADIYSATCLAMFRPLAPEQCEMDPVTRAAFEMRDAATDAALDPVLLEHRDMMYAKHLELPLRL